MKPWLRKLVRSAALAAVILCPVGFAFAYVLQSALKSQGVQANDALPPTVIGLGFGAFGFVLVAVLEVIVAGSRALAPKKKPVPDPKLDSPS